ncbi:PREDICTED: protein NRT1/ PTR FAMILY 1.1-like [Camelina sativa]|uniref:Protein NRT1/ PTR FAMILY 1.1-like n=1 Tax=Camelina sativa TaxID=90675 RepID=A0ABM0WAQ9_CAMSA|nr:PREDICTED: protein NRT1/ PTR FAMILY 1.1-like [Camelina sativa]
MENPPDQKDSSKEMLQPSSSSSSRRSRANGGLLTMPFIIGNEAFEKVASYGLLQNMILYLMSDYRLGVAKAQTVLFMWVAATNFLPLVGAFLSDSYLGRFLTIAVASLSGFLFSMIELDFTFVDNKKRILQ